MNTLLNFYTSSIGKKILMALTGFLLCSFLVVHVGGNLLLFSGDGGHAFDAYAEFLPSLLVIRIVEWLFFALFLLHIFLGTILWFRNRSARPTKYEANRPKENSTLTSRIMFLTGSIVALFLVIHLTTFWVPARFGGDEPFSMFSIVKDTFSKPLHSIFYVLAVALLGFHLHHGFQSAFQTFGIKGKRYETFIEAIGVLFWFVIPLAFAAMPLYFYLIQR